MGVDIETQASNGVRGGLLADSYVAIRPTEDAVDPLRLRMAFERLSRLLRDSEATVECLLVSPASGSLQYWFGYDHTGGGDISDEPPSVSSLESILRSALPDSYEITEPDTEHVETFEALLSAFDEEPSEDEADTKGTGDLEDGFLPDEEWFWDETADFDTDHSDEPFVSEPHADAPLDTLAALELHGRGERHRDWQHGLEAFERVLDDQSVPPLAVVADIVAETPSPVVYQVLIAAKPDWTVEADERCYRLESYRDTFWQRFTQDYLFDSMPSSADRDEDYEHLDRSHRTRMLALDQRDPRRSFDVNVRAVAFGPEAQSTLGQLASAFESLTSRYYATTPQLTTDEGALEPLSRLRERTLVTRQSRPARWRGRLPLASRVRPWLVCDPATLGSLCIVPGDRLSDGAARALGRRAGERTGLALPDDSILAYYDSGMTLGQPLTHDRRLHPTIALPADLQPLHMALVGKTGSGKSTAGLTAFASNYRFTQGANIIVDPKGDGMPIEYLRTHYAQYGSLDDVYYFDCSEVVPALSIFDIRDQLAAGIPREEAVQRVAAQFNELLVGIMGRERYERAVRSPDIITYLVKALFDPVHGSDAFGYHDLRYALHLMHETRDAPPVTDPVLEANLGDVATSSPRSFDEIMQGVANRIEKVVLDYRLATLFGYVPALDDPAEREDGGDDNAPPSMDPYFDFLEHLDRRSVVIFDLGGVDEEAKRLFTLVILTKLWTALRRRVQLRTSAGEPGERDLPLVNLYLEEAASIAHSGLLADLLSQSRAFGLSVTLALQYPGQLRAVDEDAYRELLNDVSTFVVGNVGFDPHLAERLATADLDDRAVGARLRALRRGEWFVKLPAPFLGEEPRPFYLQSAPLPQGHPDGPEPLSAARELAFEALVPAVRQRTALEYGLVTASQSSGDGRTDSAAGTGDLDGPEDATDAERPRYARRGIVHSLRMPTHATYDEDLDAILCAGCQSRYDPSATGMRRALSCCFSLEDEDRDDIPVIEYALKLTPDEREATGYTDQQLWFLLAVHYAQQRRFDPDLEYDLMRDSMLRLQEYTGVDRDGIQELLDADLLRHDCDHPHRLYSVSSAGRRLLHETTREGYEYGDGAGDLGESSQHVMAVELGRRWVEREFVTNVDSPVVEAVSYYAVGDDDEKRLDVAGLDSAGDVVVTLEAERINHDLLEAVPADFDKMAACDPEEAIWLAMDRTGAHEILRALNEPKEGPPRVTKTYSENTAPQNFVLDAPGCSQILTVSIVQKEIFG